MITLLIYRSSGTAAVGLHQGVLFSGRGVFL